MSTQWAGGFVWPTTARRSGPLVLRLRVQILLQLNAELLAEGLELLQILLVLALVLDFRLDACDEIGMSARAPQTVLSVTASFLFLGPSPRHQPQPSKHRGLQFVPSKIRTAVAKSFTRLAAFNAAAITEGDGTRS
jgi:hypothetical protein